MKLSKLKKLIKEVFESELQPDQLDDIDYSLQFSPGRPKIYNYDALVMDWKPLEGISGVEPEHEFEGYILGKNEKEAKEKATRLIDKRNPDWALTDIAFLKLRPYVSNVATENKSMELTHLKKLIKEEIKKSLMEVFPRRMAPPKIRLPERPERQLGEEDYNYVIHTDDDMFTGNVWAKNDEEAKINAMTDAGIPSAGVVDITVSRDIDQYLTDSEEDIERYLAQEKEYLYAIVTDDDMFTGSVMATSEDLAKSKAMAKEDLDPLHVPNVDINVIEKSESGDGLDEMINLFVRDGGAS